MSFPTVMGDAVEGLLMRPGQVCLGAALAFSTYNFYLTGTTTPANVYQDGNLTTPFPNTGSVSSDSGGRFPPIYLDPAVIYAVTFNAPNGTTWARDPYTPTLSTRGTSQLTSYGVQIAPTGEVTIPAPNSGGSQINLTLNAGTLGVIPLKLTATLPGNPAIIVNSSVTTGAQTATFTATNKPGTATSSPAGWLPIQADGVLYYTPIWHGNNFTPYTAQPGVLGETIAATTVTFNGNGTTSVTGGSATPSNWFAPAATGIGATYYVGYISKTGLSGASIVLPVTLTVAPSGGAYTGGTLTANWAGSTGSNYSVQFATGQLVTGCTLTNGSTTFTCPSTSVNAGATTTIYPWVTGKYVNITANGQTFQGNNVGAGANYTYALSNSITGTPQLATGTAVLQGSFGPNQATWNVSVVSGNLILSGNGSATANGVATTNWAGNGGATLANQGANYWINITQTGGTNGYAFSAAAGAWTNISNGTLSIGITPTPTSTVQIVGTYQIALDSAGVNVVGSGTVTLNGGTNVQSPNWSGTTPLFLAGNGTATLNGVATSAWYSPTTSNVGSLYWINVTRTGGTGGVNFSAAQGSWTNITNSGLSIGINGYTGLVGTATASGTWQISSSSGGTPVLGSGTISLSISGLTVIHIYTSAVTNATETIPTGTTTSTIEAWGSGGGGSGGKGQSSTSDNGSGGGGGGYVRSTLSGQVGHTWKYTIGSGGAGGINHGAGGNGSNTTVVAGTVTGWTTMTAGGGVGGTVPAGGAGGTASGGTAANTAGNAGVTGGNGGAGRTGTVSGDGSPYGAGGNPGFGTGGGSNGNRGAVVFFYQ